MEPELSDIDEGLASLRREQGGSLAYLARHRRIRRTT